MGRVVLGAGVSDRWTPLSEEDGHEKINTPQLKIYKSIVIYLSEEACLFYCLQKVESRVESRNLY